jgi:hypothetical protein
MWIPKPQVWQSLLQLNVLAHIDKQADTQKKQRDRETESQRGLRMDHDGFEWIMHGLCMDYGILCIDNAWITHGLCMGLHGLCMDYT